MNKPINPETGEVINVNSISFENGKEVQDHTPVSLPFGYDRPEPLHLRVRRMILEGIQQIKGPDIETLEEANDFDIEDDPESFDSAYVEKDYLPQMPPEDSISPQEFKMAQAFIKFSRDKDSQAAFSAFANSKEFAAFLNPSDSERGGVSSPPKAKEDGEKA